MRSTTTDRTGGAYTPSAPPEPATRAPAVISGVGIPPTRIPALDGLRGFGMLFVILAHTSFLAITGQGGAAAGVYHRFRVSGWIWVDMFFVMSGFLITGILLDARGRPRYFRNFFIRRTLRVSPPHLVFLALLLPAAAVLATRGGVLADEFRAVYEVRWWLLGYASNLLGVTAESAHLAMPPMAGALWSLALEEQFYLIWPFVVYLLPPRHLRTFCILILVAVPLLRIGLLEVRAPLSVFAYYTLLPLRLDVIAVGCLMAVVIREPDGHARLRSWRLPVLLLALPVVAAIVYRNHRFDFLTRDVVAYGFAASAPLLGVLILEAIRPGSLVARLAGLPLFRFLGKHSYATYLAHGPVVVILPALIPLKEIVPAGGPLVLYEAVWYLLMLSISTLLGWLAWHAFEKHCLALKERWAPSDGPPVVPTATTAAR